MDIEAGSRHRNKSKRKLLYIRGWGQYGALGLVASEQHQAETRLTSLTDCAQSMLMNECVFDYLLFSKWKLSFTNSL